MQVDVMVNTANSDPIIGSGVVKEHGWFLFVNQSCR